eukprot:TRINITY_DN10986_c0_g1_i1.p1 TRINITY_DN10986_c0_g1~~TRINITY_DN10986_c0_g1_i1.p1  ORF type:complete len:105 (+),score=20.21 TRINITY_DN10986_c0_g1_i1:58-372(+)
MSSFYERHKNAIWLGAGAGLTLGVGAGLYYYLHRKGKSCGTYKYPQIKRDDSVVDIKWGKKIADPYRHLEQDSVERAEWIDKQNELFNNYVNEFPHKKRINETN